MNKPNRIYQIDNMKALLIFLVVLAHFLELDLSKDRNRTIYLIIYSFHMPAFIFCTGLMAKFNPQKIKANYIFLYMVFQCLYIYFDRIVMEKENDLQFTTPNWVLWYLMAQIIWLILIPLFESSKFHIKIFQLVVVTILGILAGYDKTVGYYLSLSRILVFFPFFLAGYYMNFTKQHEKAKRTFIRPGFLSASMVIVFFAIRYIIRHENELKLVWFYGSRCYEKMGIGYSSRVYFYIVATAFIALLFFIIPNKKIPIISTIGSRSLNIFLLHVFIQRLIKKHEIYKNYSDHFLTFCMVESLIIVLVLSIKPIDVILRSVFFADYKTHFDNIYNRIKSEINNLKNHE